MLTEQLTPEPCLGSTYTQRHTDLHTSVLSCVYPQCKHVPPSLSLSLSLILCVCLSSPLLPSSSPSSLSFLPSQATCAHTLRSHSVQNLEDLCCGAAFPHLVGESFRLASEWLGFCSSPPGLSMLCEVSCSRFSEQPDSSPLGGCV